MTDTAPEIRELDTEAKSDKPEKEEAPFWKFLLKLALVVVIFRSFIFSPFNIPSESMLPRLWNGDYLLAAKWPYGYTSASLPFGVPLIPGRIFASEPARGDVVIFQHPIDKVEYIKRVIGLPGDTIAVEDGQVILNGTPIPKERIEDFVQPMSGNTPVCGRPQYQQVTPEGTQVCSYPQFRETLPEGVTYNVLDFGEMAFPDNRPPVTVPAGKMFVMGDNRDNSQDSRFPAASGGGVGMVDQDLLVGRAQVMMWSTDGEASWLLPWTWFSGRTSRIGGGF